MANVSEYPSTEQIRQAFSILAAVIAVFLVWATIVQPIGGWGTFNYIIGGLLALLLVFSVVSVVQGRIVGSTTAFTKDRAERTRRWSLIALVLFVVFLVIGIVSGDLTNAASASSVLQTGIWAYLIVYMIYSWRWASEALK
jgi:hypothetical protein